MAAVTITGFELFPLQIALKKPFITALRRVESIDDIVLVIHTDGAFKGYGAACAVTAITGTTNAHIIHELQSLVFPALLHQTLHKESLFDTLHQLRLHPESRACIDIALYDLLAKAEAKTLYAYLGATSHQLTTDLTISVDTPERMLQASMEAVKLGFHCLKIKLDANERLNLERLHAIQNALPPSVSLRLDPNQALSLEGAKHLLEHIDLACVECIEQPFKADDLVSMKRLTQMKFLPVLADESLFTLKDAMDLIERKACDQLNIKLMKCGGIAEALKIVSFAQKHKMECMMGSMLEGPISLIAAAHFALSQPNITMVDMDSPLYLKEHPLLLPFHLKEDTFHFTQEPGLGIDQVMKDLTFQPLVSFFQTPQASFPQRPSC